MKQPIFVYYQLENFYQNHRRYVKSRDYQQLMGEEVTKEDVSSSCDPIITNADLANMGIKYYFWSDELDVTFEYGENTPLVPGDVAIPCGLIAKSMFNDTFALYSEESLAENTKINIDEKNIAWESDV